MYFIYIFDRSTLVEYKIQKKNKLKYQLMITTKHTTHKPYYKKYYEIVEYQNSKQPKTLSFHQLQGDTTMAFTDKHSG